MPKFRKKPVVVEAEQYVPGKCVPDGCVLSEIGPLDEPEGHLFIMTLEGKMHVSPFDWVITGVNGEKYPCKPDIFEATYEKL